MTASRTRTVLAALLAVVLSVGLTGVLRASATPVMTLPGMIPVPASGLLAASSPAGATVAVAWLRENGAGDSELWLMSREAGEWQAPVLMSAPGTDAYDVDLEVDSDGTPVVAWVEFPETGPKRIVVRSAGASGPGARSVIDVAPYGRPVLGTGPGADLVAWSRYTGDDVERAYASVLTESGAGEPALVSDPSWTADAAVTDVAAGVGRHVAMTLRATGGYYSSAWSVWTGDEWEAHQLGRSYTGDQRFSTYVEQDPATGNVLMLNRYYTNSAWRTTATMFNADPQLILEPGAEMDERLVGPVDLGLTGGVLDIVRSGGDVVGLLGTGVVTLGTSAGNVPGVSAIRAPAAAECSNGRYVLLDDGFVCVVTPNPYGSSVELITGDGDPIDTLTPGPGATQVTATIISSALPLLLVSEYAGGTQRWLLDLSLNAAPTVTATPSSTSSPSTSATATPSPSTSTPATPSPSATPTTISPAPKPAPAMPFVVLVKKARVKGKAVVGGRLRAVPGTWSPAPTKIGYRWSVKGAKVGTGRTLKVKASMVGKKVRLRVKVTTPNGASKTTATSKKVRPRKKR